MPSCHCIDTANSSASSAISKEAVVQQAVRDRLPKTQEVHREAETQDATQNSAQTTEIEDLDLDTNLVPNIPPSRQQAPPPDTSPRKKPKLSHPKEQGKGQPKVPPKVQTKVQMKAQPKIQPKPTQQHQHNTVQPPPVSDPVLRAPSHIVKLPVNIGKKRPGSPLPASRPVKERPVAAAPPQRIRQGPISTPKARERKPQPSQTGRRSLRRAANVTFYELGWDHTQQPQKKAGPVYDGSSKPLKTKPRRLPPVPNE